MIYWGSKEKTHETFFFLFYLHAEVPVESEGFHENVLFLVVVDENFIAVVPEKMYSVYGITLIIMIPQSRNLVIV